MIEILRETDQRLVLALGANGKRRFRFILDKESAQAWFERRRRLLPARTIQVPISDIASVDASKSNLIVTFKSGVQHVFATEPMSASEAAQKLRTFLGLPEQPAGAVRASARWPRYALRGAVAVALLALIGLGALKLSERLILPACDSQRTRDTVHDLLQAKSTNPIELADFITLSRGKNEYRCSAEITVNGDSARVGYRSYWDGWTAFVRITGTIGAARLDPERIRMIDAAYDEFMTRAGDAYQSGDPPRQNDPAVNTLLTTIFDVLGLPAKTLAGSDIDEAIRWFNAGDTVGAVYLLAGTGVNDIAKLPADDAAQKMLRGNIVRFADEFGRYADFQVTLLAAIAEAQLSYAASGPPEEVEIDEFRAKADGIRSLLAQALKSDFISLVYDGLADPWRLKRLDAIARIAPAAARVLGREEAAAIRDQALQTLPYFASDEVKARVAEVAAMIGGK